VIGIIVLAGAFFLFSGGGGNAAPVDAGVAAP